MYLKSKTPFLPKGVFSSESGARSRDLRVMNFNRYFLLFQPTEKQVVSKFIFAVLV